MRAIQAPDPWTGQLPKIWCNDCKAQIKKSIWEHWTESHPEKLAEINKRKGEN